MKQMRKDSLLIQLHSSRREAGRAAAADVAAKIRELQSQGRELRMVFAAAPSQNEFLEQLLAEDGVDFARITAFHMDEYIGLDKDAPQGFGNFLRERLFGRAAFREVHTINGQAGDPQAECDRYAALLREKPLDIVCMGIGENAHIAFNDPPVADFGDPLAVKVVELDRVCRNQQVNDGCFASLEQVPTHAITLTIPVLVNADAIYCIVPAATKADAVYHSLEEAVSQRYPASILRTRPGARLYLDPDSGSRLAQVTGLEDC